jgi:hypothetical protein
VLTLFEVPRKSATSGGFKGVLQDRSFTQQRVQFVDSTTGCDKSLAAT